MWRETLQGHKCGGGGIMSEEVSAENQENGEEEKFIHIDRPVEIIQDKF